MAVSASGANAATETYDFLGSHAGTYYMSKDFSSDQGNSVNVTTGTYGTYISDGSTGGGWIGQWTGYGLGSCTYAGPGYCAERHYVDGRGKNEF
ncbi:MAG: hypothetical protein HKP29_13280, partial [Silicimonas sp.]|nr:hypothetical protein [Silicimonas sp.]